LGFDDGLGEEFFEEFLGAVFVLFFGEEVADFVLDFFEGLATCLLAIENANDRQSFTSFVDFAQLFGGDDEEFAFEFFVG
jgi:hypothetical protein